MQNETTPIDVTPPRVGADWIEHLHGLAACCVGLHVLLSPWAFGAWEMWWFWPMAALLFAGCFFSGLASLCGTTLSAALDGEPHVHHFTLSARVLAVLASVSPFLIYALIRAQFPSAPERPLVAMDAERSLLLFLTPVAAGFVLFLSFTHTRLRRLFTAIIINGVLLALYAGINQWLTYGEDKPDYVLWVLTPWGYGDRAKGPFFCPNHLSAYLNLTLCLCIGWIFTPRTPWRVRTTLSVAALVMAVTNFMTVSRGGILSLFAGLLIGIPLFAMRGYRLRARLLAPLVVIVIGGVTATVILRTENLLSKRLESHPLHRVLTQTVNTPEWRERLHDTFWYSFDRGTYIQSALRAWRSNPVWGIGPGQHPWRWTEFAATDDGIRPTPENPGAFKRPRLDNANYHLYEVHSDWMQLLEEYGLVGFILLLIPAGVIIGITRLNQTECVDLAEAADPAPRADDADAAGDPDSLPAALRRRSTHRRHRRRPRTDETETPTHIALALPLASLLAITVMSIHSLGDFSLLIPSVTWLFGALVSGGLLASNPTHRS